MRLHSGERGPRSEAALLGVQPTLTNAPIACTLSDAAQRRRQWEFQQELLPGIREVVELEDGHALRFPGEPGWVRRAAELVALERACCPFLTLELVAEPEQGPVWLELWGPEGTKAFLARSFELCRGPRTRSMTLD